MLVKLGLAAIPQSALWLGAAGLIPFVAGLGGAMSPLAAVVGPAGMLLYGAVILSFMGGVHWGSAMSAAPLRAGQLALSVLPALVAWAAVLIGGRLGLLIEAVGFAALLAFDLVATTAGWAPAWYPALRVLLTTVAVLCLLAAAILT